MVYRLFLFYFLKLLDGKPSENSRKIIGKPSVKETVGKQSVKAVGKQLEAFSNQLFSDARFVGKPSVKSISDCFPTVSAVGSTLFLMVNWKQKRSSTKTEITTFPKENKKEIIGKPSKNSRNFPTIYSSW